MDASILIQGLGLAGVVTAMILEFRGAERSARTGVAKARTAGPERRCPFCHLEFEESEVQVRCASCSTAHHAECWSESLRCSIFGCGSEHLRESPVRESEPPPAPVTEPSVEPEAQPEVTEDTPCG